MNIRSRKALSPVVASIILIAVTVAVSIAVAAWMGALTFNFMATEQIKITNMAFPTGQVTITIMNTGTSPVTIAEVHINNGANILSTCTNATWSASPVVPAGKTYSETFTFTWTNGVQYEAELRSSKGNQFTYTATAPS
jgi:flagellin-like protein